MDPAEFVTPADDPASASANEEGQPASSPQESGPPAGAPIEIPDYVELNPGCCMLFALENYDGQSQ